MTNWTPNLSHRRGALYRAIADALANDVAAGRLAVGARLPTHRALADAVGVTVGTVTRAYAEAERRGLVDATVGRGTFVAPQVDTSLNGDSRDAACFPSMSPARWHAQATTADYKPDGQIELSVNYPVTSFLPRALGPGIEGLADPARLIDVAGYQPSNGRADHRAAGAHWMAQFGLEANAEDVVVVHGTQGGLTVALTTLARPGDTVLVEQLTWPGMQSLAQVNGVKLAPVTMDAEGLDPDALRDAARRTGARLVYCMPTLHNPTNITLSEARRHALLQVAREENLLLIEDDIYGFLADEVLPPLATLDPERAIYVTSLSKSVSPGLRVGFLKGPSRLIPRFTATMRATTLMVSSISAEIATRLIESGHAWAAAQAQKQESTARQTLVQNHLADQQLLTAPTSFHLLLQLPEQWSTTAYATEALQRNVSVTPGTAFTVDGTDPHSVRLCLSAVSERASLERGLEILGRLVRERPEARMPVV